MGNARIAGLLASALLFGSLDAKAEDKSRDPTRAAGWVVLGLGTALGGGSVATGAIMTGWSGDSTSRANATGVLVGGAITVAVSLAIGIPLILTSDDKGDTRVVQDAMAGRVRF